jgi:hypothetical protein
VHLLLTGKAVGSGAIRDAHVYASSRVSVILRHGAQRTVLGVIVRHPTASAYLIHLSRPGAQQCRIAAGRACYIGTEASSGDPTDVSEGGVGMEGSIQWAMISATSSECS